MTESESVALPFGDSAMSQLLNEVYTIVLIFASPFFKIFQIFETIQTALYLKGSAHTRRPFILDFK